MPIEDQIEPETVNEVLLLNRIRELKLAAYKVNSYDLQPFTARDDILSLDRIQPMLVLAGELKAGWEANDQFYVQAQAHCRSDKTLHYGHYISRELLQKWEPRAAAQQLGKMHKRALFEIAHLLEKGEL